MTDNFYLVLEFNIICFIVFSIFFIHLKFVDFNAFKSVFETPLFICNHKRS